MSPAERTPPSRDDGPVEASGAEFPDLLHPRGETRIDLTELSEALTFAFASGVSGGLFADALAKAKPSATTWDPPSFAKDLFLDEFVQRCFKAKAAGREVSVSRTHLLRVLAAPPADPRVVVFRRAIAAELVERPDLRKEFERLYHGLARLRGALEGAAGTKKWDQNRRQLEVLQLAREIFDRCADGFADARSGLARLHAFGARVRSGEPFRSLVDLLTFDEDMASLNLDVRVGADGTIRRFEIRRLEENRENPFGMSPIRRWLAQVELFLRGYRFGSGEIMARLLDAVFEGVLPDVARLIQLAGEMEVYLGALEFRDMARAAGLEACLPDFAEPGEPRTFDRLWNPLLVAHGVKAVPCDLASDRHDTTILITGPNSGGKTRLLQSVALAQLLAQSGLFVPARAARLAVVPGLVVSLIQEAKADQSEGRLGTELVRIRDLFERLPPGAMVILDELCSGTNPSEGEEIFELVVSLLSELRPQAFVTTHFLGFAQRLQREAHIAELRYLQVELDGEQRPTYQFVPGVATTSLAHRAAARLGVTREQLLALVERSTSPTGKARP